MRKKHIGNVNIFDIVITFIPYKLMKKKLLFFYLLLLSFPSMAKDGYQGIIVDASDNPMKGIRVNIVGLFKYRKTNANGIFTFNKVFENDTLMVYYNDKKAVKIPIDPVHSPKITLYDQYASCATSVDTTKYLYQPVTKKAYNNDIITERQIKERTPKDLVEILRGNIAGLRIIQDGGIAKASLRNSTSFELNTEPLFIIDHSEYETLEAANNSVSPEDIKEITVIKDGNGYGMKGANGVIIITTKNN